MQEHLLEWLFRLAKRRGLVVLGVVAGISALLAFAIPSLRISTGHSEMMPAHHPDQRRFKEFMDEFGAADNLVVVLEGDTETLISSADYFARALREEKEWVKGLFYRIDLETLQSRAPLFVPVEQLEKGLEVVKKQRSLIDRFVELNSVMAILKATNAATELGRGAKIEGVDIEVDTAIIPAVFNGMARLFEEWNEWVNDPSHNKIRLLDKLLTTGTEAEAIVKSGGYLLSRDRQMLFLFVQPTSPSDDRSYLKPFIGALRGAVNQVYKDNPKLREKVKVSFTGMPAHVLAESDTVFADVGAGGAVSTLAVVFILLVGFRSLRKTILATIPLTLGIIIMLGWSSLYLGRLNLVSAAFLAVLYGIGIDFGIYLIRRTEEELGNGHGLEKSVHIATVQAGKGVLTGGLTTGLAFFALTWTDFAGFAELGLVAGTGVLVTMACTLLVLPALLLRSGIEPHRYDVKWLISISDRAHNRGLLVAITVAAMAVTAWSLWVGQRVGFDYNALNLLPANTESTVAQLKMQDRSDFQISFAAVTATTLEELKARVAKAQQLPTVARVDSLAAMIPDDQQRKLKVIREFRPYLANVRVEPDRTLREASEYAGELKKLRENLQRVQDDAFAGGQGDIVEAVEGTLTALGKLPETLEGERGEVALQRTRAFEKALFASLGQVVDLVHKWLDATPLTEQSFPPELLARFKSPKGTYVAYVFPKGSIWDLEFLDLFVGELRQIDAGVTGFPVTHRVHSRLAVDSLVQSVLYAFVLICALLLIDFRGRIGSVFLSLVPLVLGLLWAQGGLYLLKRSYNYANIAAVPLLMGLGVVYGVHMVHRWLENTRVTAFAAADTTGQAVGLSALTTIVGLLSIVFARHTGVATFGIVLLLGISMCLVTSVYVLPALIDLFNPRLAGPEETAKDEKSH